MMRSLNIILPVVLTIFLIGNAQQSIAQTKTIEKKTTVQISDKQFDKEWQQVKENYPRVAMEYLRREAFAYEVARVFLDKKQFGDDLAVSQEYYLFAQILCSLYRIMQIPVPLECQQVITRRIGDISSCFEPKPNGEMPTVSEAEDCVKEQFRPRKR